MIQFDYPSGGIGRKERKRYTFSGFRGVDASVAAINVDPVRAVESTNFVDRNGVLHKRYGWAQEYQFDAEINGFWRIVLDGTAYTICYAGKSFYRLSDVYGWKEEYTSDKLVSRRTSCYVQNDKAYFIGCGDLLVFRFDSNSGSYAFFRVEDDAETYIPTTTAQIIPEGLKEEGLNGQYVRDGVNLLTGWRKNTLVGRVVPENGKLIYKLDSPPTMDEEKKAHLSVLGAEHIFSYAENSVISTPEESVLDDVNAYSLQIVPHTLTEDDATELINSTDGIDYPDVEYDEIKEAGTYGRWVLQLSGKNGLAGLRWKRENNDFCTRNDGPVANIFRAYTLYFVADSNSVKTKPVPVLRRYFMNPTAESLITTDYELSWTRNVYENLNSFVLKASKSKNADIDFEIRVMGDFTAIGSDLGHKYEYFSITIPKGKLSAEITIEAVLSGEVSASILNVEAYKTIENAPRPVSESEILNSFDEINLPTPEECTQSLSMFLTSNTATVEMIEESSQKIVSFYGASLVCEEEGFHGNIDNLGVLSISEWGIAEDSSTANVEVKFYVNHNKADWISTCKYSMLYGVDGGADRLFVANGDDNSKSNIILFSEMNEFTYFPDNFTKAVGGNANEIQGFIRLANGSMAALKTLQGNEPTVFVFNGEYISGYYDAEETEPYMLPRFSTSGVSTTQGIIAPYACSNLADDSLFLSQNGVYALELSQGTDSQRFAKERSLPINNLLKSCNISDLKNACAITHENKYYLAVKHYKKTSDKTVEEGKTYYEKVETGYSVAKSPDPDLGMSRYYEQKDYVYVADAHYSFTPIGAMSDTPSYEWYPLENIPVRLWFLLDGELYFGTNDGRVCRFVKNQYYDVEKSFYASETAIDGVTVKKYSQISARSITLKLDSNNNGGLDTFVVSEDADIEEDDSIIFLSGSLQGLVYDESINLVGTELYIVKGEEGKIQLKYKKEDKLPLEFFVAHNLVAAVLKKRVVKASRTLPTFDFGMPDYLKSMESFTITMNGVEGGYSFLDIYTRNNQSPNQNVKGQSKFNNLNGMGKVSFNVPFQNSYTKKICVRNFNYAIFKIYNEEPVDCSVASLSVFYKYNRASGGIR